MGAVPLLTRRGEVALARRMERGKLQMHRAISRSLLIQKQVLALYEEIKRGELEVDAIAVMGDFEEGSPERDRQRTRVRQKFVSAHPGEPQGPGDQRQTRTHRQAETSMYDDGSIGPENGCWFSFPERFKTYRSSPFSGLIFARELERALG